MDQHTICYFPYFRTTTTLLRPLWDFAIVLQTILVDFGEMLLNRLACEIVVDLSCYRIPRDGNPLLDADCVHGEEGELIDVR